MNRELNNQIKHKPKIALVVDVQGWCFWNIANEIKNNLGEYYDFEIIPLENIDNNIISLIFYVKDFDLVHFFWRGHLSLFKELSWYIRSFNLTLEEYSERYLKNLNITTSVYDHLYLDNIDFTNSILSYVKNYTVSSQKLFKIYNENDAIIKKPQMVISDGVNLELFKPKNLERFKQSDSLVIGWVGNSKWANIEEDVKGFKTILKPVLSELINERYNIKTSFADKQIKMIAHEDMPDYYNKLDVLICVSKVEGTPNPVLEAMACGVPIITTDVGIVNEVLGPKQKEFILSERSQKALKEAILKLYNDKSVLEELSQENLKQIKKWDWQLITQKFQKFFDSNLK